MEKILPVNNVMYDDFYGLKADPFRLSPDHHFSFTHRSYKKAQAYLTYALHRAEGFVMVTGRPGTGKTTLISDLLDNDSFSKVKVGMLVSTQLEANDLLRMATFSFGLSGKLSDKSAILQEFTNFLTRLNREGRRAVLIVDEAQDLAVSAIEELRLLTNLQIDNQPLLQIFLVGQEELRDLMQGPRMEQGHQRIVAACHLESLNEDETEAYIKHRLYTAGWNGDPQISSTIYPIIHKFSLGIPRRINLICSRLFLQAFVEEHHKIGVNDIRITLTELQQEQLMPSSLPTHPTVDEGDFLGLVDNYTTRVEHSSKLKLVVAETLIPDVSIPGQEAPMAPDDPEPLKSETPDPLLVPTLGPDTIAPEEDDTLCEKILPDSRKLPQHPMLAATDIEPAIRRKRYGMVALSFTVFFAIGGAFYLYSLASYDSPTLYQQALQLKTNMLSYFGPQKPAITSNTDSSTQQLGRLMISQEQTTPSSVQGARFEPVDLAESKLVNDPVIVDDVELAMKKPTIESQPMVSSDIDSDVISLVVTAPESKPKLDKPQVRQILFGYKSIKLEQEYQELLDEVVQELVASQNAVAQIVGVVDDRGKGSSETNRRVSMRRAERVSDYIKSRGIVAERLRIEEDADRQEKMALATPERLVNVTVVVPTD